MPQLFWGSEDGQLGNRRSPAYRRRGILVGVDIHGYSKSCGVGGMRERFRPPGPTLQTAGSQELGRGEMGIAQVSTNYPRPTILLTTCWLSDLRIVAI